MQEIVVNTWCDRHSLAGERVAGQPFALSLPGHPGRELDLCQPCRSDMFDELLQLVADRSRPADTPPGKVVGKVARKGKAPGEASPASGGQGELELVGDRRALLPDCPVCEMRPTSFPSLEQHMRNHHGTSLAKLVGKTCPVCGIDSGVLGSHGAKTHDAPTLLDLLAQGRQLGDPHGVVARATTAFTEAAAA